jgi:hypothetical protein
VATLDPYRLDGFLAYLPGDEPLGFLARGERTYRRRFAIPNDCSQAEMPRGCRWEIGAHGSLEVRMLENPTAPTQYLLTFCGEWGLPHS